MSGSVWRGRGLFAAVSGVALAMAATAAWAAGEDAQPASEVVVTGRTPDTRAVSAEKSDIPIVETPQSISVVDRTDLDLRVVTDLNQALRYTAGVGPDTRGNTAGRYDQQTLRGFSPDQYLDGLRLIGSQNGYDVPQIDITTLQRIEVVKGPASVLYGQGSPGGIVALSSKLPTQERFGEIALTGGSFGYGQGALDLGGRIDDAGRLSFRLDAVANRNDTEIAHTRAERYGVNPSLTWRPDDKTSWTLLYSYQKDPEAGDYGAMPPLGTLLPNPNGRVARDFFSSEPGFEQFRREQNALTSLFSRQLGFGDWTLRQNTRFLRTTTFYQSVYFFSINPDLRTIPRYADAADEGLDNLTTDTSVAGTLKTGPVEHALVIGVDYQHTGQSEAAGFAGAASDLDIFNPVYGKPVTPTPITFNVRLNLEQTGVYVQDQAALGGFRLMLAGRYDWVDSSQFDKIGKTTAPLDEEKFTGRAALLYLFDNGLAPYVAYSTSFEPQTATDKNGNVLAPTGGKQTEVGVKYQPKVWDTLVTLSLYDLRQTNVATQDPSDPGGFFSIAAGEIRSRGVELEGSTRPRPGMELHGSYTYLDNKYIRDNSGLLGARPYGVPQQTANLYGLYTIQAGPMAGVGLGGGVRYLGQSYNGVAGGTVTKGEYKIPDATLFDLLGAYDLSKLSARLNGVTANLD
ncbi:MAG: TonB-dependent siderophore receptor, partial [Caulobacteraceae bacterium]|nr:TonB-dependent siderophore receptor [Caulobacter sp.]